MNTITIFEETTMYVDTIPFYGEPTQVKKQKNDNKTREYSYIEEAINEAFKTFCKADKKTFMSKSNSRYFYNKHSVDVLFSLLKEQDLQHELGVRNISKDIKHPCYEVNFKEVLNRTKPELY